MRQKQWRAMPSYSSGVYWAREYRSFIPGVSSETCQPFAICSFTVVGVTQQGNSIVQNAWKVFASHDAERITEVFTEDAEWLAPAGNATAIWLDAPSHMVGRTAIARFIAEDFPRLFARDVTVTFHGFYRDGERVVVEETMTATLSNGNHYANDYCFVFELRDGLIHRVREYMDTARGHRMIFSETAL